MHMLLFKYCMQIMTRHDSWSCFDELHGEFEAVQAEFKGICFQMIKLQDCDTNED